MVLTIYLLIPTINITFEIALWASPYDVKRDFTQTWCLFYTVLSFCRIGTFFFTIRPIARHLISDHERAMKLYEDKQKVEDAVEKLDKQSDEKTPDADKDHLLTGN
jgi:hypothetical protein